jgi:formate-dependent nitrite reductase membrane component NrfD
MTQATTQLTPARVRYTNSIDPIATDGRDVDSAIATLNGEGAQQQAGRPEKHLQKMSPSPWSAIPGTSAETTYYGRPMLKRSVWSVDIPIYYFLGGAAGASMTLGAALQLASPRDPCELRRLAAVCHWAGIVGSSVGAAFLIHDLGRPSRFLNMMRVFRPTSPMNMGTWILGGAAPSAIATGLFINRRGLLGFIGEATGYISGLFGAALAGYTGVLISNTAIPIWQASRRWAPVLFIGSSAASAASVLDIFAGSRSTRRVAQIFGTAGRATEIVAAKQVERSASAVPRVGRPFERGGPALLWKAASILTGASLALSLLPRKSRTTRVAGVLGLAGSLCLRFAVHYLGDASASDPRASFDQQRPGERAR